MPIIGQTFPQLIDAHKASGPGQVIELLAQDNPILDDAIARACNMGATERTMIRTGLPTATCGRLYQGVPQSKTTMQQVDDTTGFLEARSSIDTRLLKLAKDPAKQRLIDSAPFFETMNQEMATGIFYHDIATTPERFRGLGARYDAFYTGVKAGAPRRADVQVVDGGGRGSDNTSIWFVTWGDHATSLIYPEGTTAGVTMQDKGEESKNSEAAKALWIEAAKSSASFVKVMHDMNIHKQVCNRLIEPFQMMKTCITATQWGNFFNLRLHTDADPTIYALAEAMKSAMNSSKPQQLKEGEWHIPFVNEVRVEGNQVFYDQDGFQISVEDALMISCSCSAQTSYRLNDYSLEKAKIIYDKLINSKPAHSSPTEHCAMPITRKNSNPLSTPLDYFGVKGVTHIDRNLGPCSGNFHGWVQYRQLIPDNAVMY